MDAAASTNLMKEKIDEKLKSILAEKSRGNESASRDKSSIENRSENASKETTSVENVLKGNFSKETCSAEELSLTNCIKNVSKNDEIDDKIFDEMLPELGKLSNLELPKSPSLLFADGHLSLKSSLKLNPKINAKIHSKPNKKRSSPGNGPVKPAIQRKTKGIHNSNTNNNFRLRHQQL